MKMGQYIKTLREGQKITQEELGKSLNPPVNRAAVNKWETGQVENIKRTHILQLARKFHVSPSDLMCFDINTNENDEEITKLIHLYQELDDLGKEKVLEMTSIMIDLQNHAFHKD